MFFLYNREHCREDYIEIYDGKSKRSPLIGRFCGSTVPEITASGGHMYLVFVSSADVPPYGHVGFHANAIAITKGKLPCCHRGEGLYNYTVS